MPQDCDNGTRQQQHYLIIATCTMRAIAQTCKSFLHATSERPGLEAPEQAYEPVSARGLDGIFAHGSRHLPMVCPTMHPILPALWRAAREATMPQRADRAVPAYARRSRVRGGGGARFMTEAA